MVSLAVPLSRLGQAVCLWREYHFSDDNVIAVITTLLLLINVTGGNNDKDRKNYSVITFSSLISAFAMNSHAHTDD